MLLWVPRAWLGNGQRTKRQGSYSFPCDNFLLAFNAWLNKCHLGFSKSSLTLSQAEFIAFLVIRHLHIYVCMYHIYQAKFIIKILEYKQMMWVALKCKNSEFFNIKINADYGNGATCYFPLFFAHFLNGLSSMWKSKSLSYWGEQLFKFIFLGYRKIDDYIFCNQPNKMVYFACVAITIFKC